MKTLITIALLFIYTISNAQGFNYDRIWATYFGGEDTVVLDDAIDSIGNVYIVGLMQGNGNYLQNYTTDGAFQTQFGGGESDGFIAKFSPDGLLLWSTLFGGNGIDAINTIGIDSNDHIFIAGVTSSENMATSGAYSETLSGIEDAFLSEFDIAGQRLWTTYYGGIYKDSFSGLECDNLGNLYLFGRTSSQQGITTPGSFQENFIPNSDFQIPESDMKDFVIKFTTAGERLWCTYYGTNISGGHSSSVTGITHNDFGIFIVGFMVDTSANTYFATQGCYQPYNSTPSGFGIDMFLSKFSFDGNRIWSTYFGGTNSDKSVGYGGTQSYTTNFRNVKATRDLVYIAGISSSSTNVATPGAFQTTKQFNSNFIAQFTDEGVRQWGTYVGNDVMASGGAEFYQFAALCLDTAGEIYLSGCTNFNDVASPDGYQPTVSTDGSIATGHVTDSFVAKFSKDGSTRYFGTYYGGNKPENGANTLLYNDSFYIIGTTTNNYNISTPGGYQQELNITNSPGLYPKNAFIAKFTEIPLGTTTQYVDKNAMIYPVPNNGTFTVNLNPNYLGSTIAIYDISGKKIYQDTLKSASQEMNCKGISNGTYIVKITNAAGLGYEQRIIVE